MGCACRQNKNNVQQEQPINNSVVPSESDLNMITAETFKTNIELEPVAPVQSKAIMERPTNTQSTPVTRQATIIERRPAQQSQVAPEVIREALENNLKSCYLCAKKHLMRAKIFFEEYHTGYPDHIKNLVQSLRVAEVQVRSAFLKWQQVMGHLDMAANELLGNDINAVTMNKEHIILANKIRDARIRLSDNPLASVNFDDLITKVHLLQYKELEK